MESALGGSQFTFMEYWLSVQWRYINLNNICKVRCQFAKRVSLKAGQQHCAPARPVLQLRQLSCSMRGFVLLQPQPVQDVGSEAQSGVSVSAALLERNFVTPRARPSNSTSTPRRGDVFLFLRKFYALVVVYRVLFFLFAGLIYYLLQSKLLLIFPFWLVDIPEQRRAGNHAYILEFRPCLFGLVGIYYRLRGAVCFMFSFSHFFYSLSRIVWNFFGQG